MEEAYEGRLAIIIISACGVISNTVLLTMIFKSHVLRNYDNYFSIGQLISDLLLSITLFVSFSLTLKDSLFLQDHSNCQINGFLVNFLSLVPLFFACSIPTSAYRIIVKGNLALTFNQTMLRIGLILFSSVVVAAIPMICDIHFTIQDNQGYCFHDFHSSSVNHNLSIISTGIAFGLPIVAVAYVYYSIWKQLHNTIHAASFILNYTLQITVARRGLLVIMVYLVGYAFPLTCCIYKGLTKNTMSLWVENVIISLVTGHACVNPLVYYMAEPRLRRSKSNRQLRNNQVAPANRQINTTTTDDKEPLVHPFYKKVRQVRTIHDISNDLSNNL
ncbi:hypothetical protein BC833DRAFT_653168 [Globomyces pollinis-pini]|nr:hypothetical protein BC833DRAFT_653168 [Globomyces pollinis-pini]